MIFDYKYKGNSKVATDANSVGMQFAPDVQRDPTFFVGKLHKKLAFREAISALHDVVVSDLRFVPKDREAYMQWLKEQESIWLSDYIAENQVEATRERIAQIKEELQAVYKEKDKILGPFNKAKKAYFDYLYQKDRDAWFVLDPVITVHPDEVFFECFSQDESSYGKLSCNYNVFTQIDTFACGTTNIDYSQSLYNEFQKIRDYKETSFAIDPSGFETRTTNEEEYKEVKIDLPDSWVRGFLQVSSAMTLPAVTFDLHPQDMYLLCSYLRRFKEQKGPRALRFILKPGQPVQVLFEPWHEIFTFYRSPYTGSQEQTIRIWGRRRLHILERLLPIASRFTVHLLGNGLPSFFIAHLGDMTFTLGLSGWTANDWSQSGNFDLMAPRTTVDQKTQEQIFNTLKKDWLGTSDAIAKHLGLTTDVVASSLAAYTQAGRVIYDLHKGVYRVRELSQEPLPMTSLRFASEQEEKANRLLQEQPFSVKAEVKDAVLHLAAKIKDQRTTFQTEAQIDKDNRMISGSCSCNYFLNNGLRKGPCEHLLALRMEMNRN
ncbi:SWIM zinc finger-containing protein [Flavobacterium sp. 9AF]|uniref:SWIM zinc finger family protein n=1 Tax=Flavobacterium sp. 9AF TaxID=2653142 RepID=UPI0012F037CC|nr:SWIM zinc finger family protein [Flavobacterium sp. 9AF]VXC34606.1 SWIM zinc finger-containing protein [Flavobacterium sp. 9AF]